MKQSKKTSTKAEQEHRSSYQTPKPRRIHHFELEKSSKRSIRPRFIKKASDIFEDFPIAKGRRKNDPSSLNISASFDIETSSFYQNKLDGRCIKVSDFYKIEKTKEAKNYEKRACLCAWGFGLNGKLIFGRTWEEFIDLLKLIQKTYHLDPKRLILPVYIHNESYEFQWICHRFNWVSVFAVKDRYPIRALCDLGIEFRDSLILSGMSLEKTAEGLLKYKVYKLYGSWDYSLIRGSKTKIEPKEWEYLRNDNLCVMAYIQELLEEYGNINRIPMTKTGFVREDLRNACFWEGKSHKHDHNNKFVNYSRLMSSLTLQVSEYRVARHAFAGGFTHANAFNACAVLHDVESYDISSSYPTCICSERFPMSKGREVKPKTIADFAFYLKHYACIMEIALHDVTPIVEFEHIISRSKCLDISGYEEDNGRIIRAKYLRICITNIDYECFEKFYRWKNIDVFSLWIYQLDYLPKPIVAKTLEYYESKTTLKGIPEKEAEYARAKTLINSIFGCMVMDVCRPEITFDENWEIIEKPTEKQIEEYNKSKSRFNFFLWGIFITSLAKRNILSFILEAKEDHVYTDTDSEKLLNASKHMKFIERYNELIDRKIENCLKYHSLDLAKANPKSIDGQHHPLGHFELDGKYARFKTLGAKRYAIDYGKPKDPDKPWTQYSLTISGVNKNTAIPAIYKRMQEERKDFFDYFFFGVVFDREMCGKKLHTYIDDEIEGVLTDKDGIEMPFHELSCVHLEETTYEMTGSDEYISLLENIDSIMYID